MTKNLNDLPTDVLLIIFYWCAPRRFRRDGPPLWSVLPLLGGHVGPDVPAYCVRSERPSSRFPENLASVCRLWREILATVSSFWKRLVIWVGRDPTPLPKIIKYLHYSRLEPIDIFLLRRYDPRIEDETERVQVETVMKILVPHMDRWRSFIASLLHSSSLPRPAFDLTGRADLLQALHLDVIHDEVVLPKVTADMVQPFETPALKRLSMGGLHFRESYVKLYPLTPLPPDLAELTLREYDIPLPSFPLVDLLRCLVPCTKLEQLTLANMQLTINYNGPPLLDPQAATLWNAHVHFFDMGGFLIASLSRLLSRPFFECISYTRCFIPQMLLPSMPGGEFVYMEGLTSWMDVLQIVAGQSNLLSASHLHVTKCDGFGQGVLDVLGTPFLSVATMGGLWACARLKSLVLEDCKAFSSADVRRLVQTRREAHAATGFAEVQQPDFEVTSITRLEVRGCCPLADEDDEWFERNPLEDGLLWSDS